MSNGDLHIDMSVLTHEPAEAYHAKAGEFLSSHLLADFRACPQLYLKRRLRLLPDLDGAAFELGEATHCRILEGKQEFAQRYLVSDGPVNPKTDKPFDKKTNAYRDWLAAQDRLVVAVKDAELIENLCRGVGTNLAAMELLVDGEAEGVVRTEYCGLPCQIRLDWLNPYRGIVDLKTCADLTWFEVDSRRLGYGYQLAFYRAVFAQATGEVVPAYLVAIEKKEPYRCGMWRISEDTLNQYERENAAAIERLKECDRRNEWPTGYEEPRVLELI